MSALSVGKSIEYSHHHPESPIVLIMKSNSIIKKLSKIDETFEVSIHGGRESDKSFPTKTPLRYSSLRCEQRTQASRHEWITKTRRYGTILNPNKVFQTQSIWIPRPSAIESAIRNRVTVSYRFRILKQSLECKECQNADCNAMDCMYTQDTVVAGRL